MILSYMDTKKLFDVSGKVIILTGASGFLGTQFAEGLSQAGAHVVLADTNFKRCKELELKFKKKYNASPLAVKLDVTSKKSIKNMISKILKKYSKIDVLINNAAFQGTVGKQRAVDLVDVPLSIWNKGINVNLTGVFLVSQLVGKVFLKQKHGIIINISSAYGMIAADQRIYAKSGQNSMAFYAATKSALLNLTRYFASYWNRTGIRVNSLSPGGVERIEVQGKSFIKNYSYKTMLGRMAHKDEYIGALIFLCSNSSSYMTGSNLVFDGGFTAW